MVKSPKRKQIPITIDFMEYDEFDLMKLDEEIVDLGFEELFEMTFEPKKPKKAKT